MNSGACGPNTRCCSQCSLAIVAARARVTAGAKLPTRNDGLDLERTLVAFLRASADGKRLWLEDEDGTEVALEGLPPPSQALDRIVQVSGSRWKLLHSGSGGNRCILSAAVKVLDNTNKVTLCPAALALLRGPPSFQGVSLPISEPMESVRDLLASSRSRKRDRHGTSMSRRKLTLLKGRVVALSPVIQTPDAPPVCFLILEDAAECAPEVVQDSASSEPLPRVTLMLSGSTLVWRRFMSCGDTVVVSAVHVRHSKLEIASSDGSTGLGGVERFIAFGTTEAREVSSGGSEVPLQDESRDWVAVARTETVVIRLASGSHLLHDETSVSGDVCKTTPPLQGRPSPKLDESVVHYTGVITGAFALTSLDERSVGASAKHLIIKLDHGGTLLFLQHWPLLSDAGAAVTSSSTPPPDSASSSSPSSPSSTPAWVAWLTAGTTLQLRHVHPVYMWGKLRGFAACAATEITPLLVGASGAPTTGPVTKEETGRASSSSASAGIGTPAWTTSAARSLGKAYSSRSGIECCATLAWARLVERNLDDKRAALGGTAWARQAAVAVRRAAVASKAVPSPVHHTTLPLEFLKHDSACHVVSGVGGSSSHVSGTIAEQVSGKCCDSMSQWPLVPSVADLCKHLKSRRGGWQQHIKTLVKRHNCVTASRADARAAGREGENSNVATGKSNALAGQCWILRFHATSNAQEREQQDDDDDDNGSDNDGNTRSCEEFSDVAGRNMSTEAPSQDESRDYPNDFNDDATWQGAHLIGRCRPHVGQASPLLCFDDGTGTISVVLTSRVSRQTSSSSSSSPNDGVEDLNDVIRRGGVPFSELLSELPSNSSSSNEKTVANALTVLRLANFRVVTEILHLEAQGSKHTSGQQHHSRHYREAASEVAPGGFIVHHGGHTFLVTHLVQCCGCSTNNTSHNNNVEVITPEHDDGPTSSQQSLRLRVPPLEPLSLAPMLGVTNAPPMLATILQKGVRYSSAARAPSQESSLLSSSSSSSSSLSFSASSTESSLQFSMSSTKPLYSPLHDKELILRCRFFHEPRKFDLLIPFATSVTSASLPGLFPGSLIAIQGARLDLSDLKRSSVLTFTLLPSAILRLIALPPVVAPAALAQCDAMQVDWRALPSAPPLASFIGSSTTAPVLPLTSTPPRTVQTVSTTSPQLSTTMQTSSLSSSSNSAPLPAVPPLAPHAAPSQSSWGAATSPSLTLLRLRFTIIHVAFAAVHPNTCAVCGMPPYAPPPTNNTTRHGAIMSSSSSLLGLPCRRSLCRGVTSNRFGWEFSCIADDGTAKAVVRADGAAAESLLNLSVHLAKSLESQARHSGQQVILTSTTAPLPPRHRDAITAALIKAKGRNVIGCCVVVGSRLENSLTPLRAAQAAEDLAAGIKPTANSASSTSGRGLADGWTCHKCKNRNFPSRSSCNSCRAPKPSTSTSANTNSSSSSSSSITGSRFSGNSGSTSGASVILEASTAEAGDVKWTTAALPRLELKCFHADVVDSQLEAHLKLARLTQSKKY